MGPSKVELEEEVRVGEVERPSTKVIGIEARRVAGKSRPPASIAGSTRAETEQSFFRSSLLEQHRFKSSSRTLDLAVAILVHAIVIAGPIFAGLYFTDTINLKHWNRHSWFRHHHRPRHRLHRPR